MHWSDFDPSTAQRSGSSDMRQESIRWACRCAVAVALCIALVAALPLLGASANNSKTEGGRDVTRARAVARSVPALPPPAAGADGTSELRERVLGPNGIDGYSSISSHRVVRGVRQLSEDLDSLCIKVAPKDILHDAGFISGYEESLGSHSPSVTGVALSIVARFASRSRASMFLQRNDGLCSSAIARRKYEGGVVRLRMRVPGYVGYRLGDAPNVTDYWVMFAVGRYLYAEALLTSQPAEHRFAKGSERLYERVREVSRGAVWDDASLPG
jgi:hypothetical protein